MKNRVIWIMFMVVALVSSGAWAVWNPNEAALQFNLNFETNSDPCTHAWVPAAVDARTYMIGKHSSGTEANSTDHAIYELNALSATGLGTDANFQPIHDAGSGVVKYGPNDIKIRIPYDTYGPTGNSIFDLAGNPVASTSAIRTWAFWIWTMHKDGNYNLIYPNATLLRLARTTMGGDPNYNWEIRLTNCTVEFAQKNGPGSATTLLTAQTAQTLDQMGLTPNQWHHVAVSVNRNTRTGTRMFVDGLERAVTILDYRTTEAVAISDYLVYPGPVHRYNPLMVGSGSKKFDGMLDEVRLYNRALSPLEVSILKQTDTTAHPIALQPIPGSSDIQISTDVNWVPATSVVQQRVSFGTDPCALTVLKNDDTTGVNTLYNSELNSGEVLALNTTYYWTVDSDFGAGYFDGPTWSFTTETGKAKNPTPVNGQDYVSGPNNNIKLMWDEPTTHPASYSVYLSSDKSLVEANDVSVRIMDSVDANDANKVVTARGTEMFWRVISNYTGQSVTGDTWSFRTRPYEIIFNVIKGKTRYSDHDVNGLAMIIKDANWTQVQIGTVAADANIAVFNFASGFNYDRRYDIVVIPAYIADDIHTDLVPTYDVNTPRPLGLHVTGDFYFDGRINISGDDVTNASLDAVRTRAGGAPGPKTNAGSSSVFNDHGNTLVPVTNYYTAVSSPTMTSGVHKRLGGPGNIGGKYTYVPTALAQKLFGLGMPANPPYKGGAGGSYGGQGGNAGRGYDFGIEVSMDRNYGDSPVPIPFGGSSGGWSGNGPGGSGGGGIEIIATGDVNLDAHSAILANGSSQNFAAELGYGTGGGSGGSVKIISGGKFTNKGTISANGGFGSRSTASNNAGGGGGGGRVAINYVTAGSTQGTVTVDGGAKGYFTSSGTQISLGEDGKAGTILYTTASPKIASNPVPANGDKKVYIGTADPNPTFELKWHSGYGASTDRVWFGTSSGSLAAIGSDVTATRAQHSVTQSVNKNRTYYWQVKSDSGAVLSPIWSFSTVSWQCPIAVAYGTVHVRIPGPSGAVDPCMGTNGPEWDHNVDCAVNEEDFAFLAKNWSDPSFGAASSTGIEVVGMTTLRRFAFEWLECYGRTNSGCNGW